MVSKTKYQSILQISFRHGYYFQRDGDRLVPGPCLDLSFQPTKSAMLQLRNLGIRFQVSENEFELQAPENKLSLIGQYNKPIYIELILHRPLFLHYTHLLGRRFSEDFSRHKILLFSNQDIPDRFMIQHNEYASLHEVGDKLLGLWELDDNLKGKNISKAVFEQTSIDPEKRELVFDPPVNGDSIPLTNLPEGRYRKVTLYNENDHVVSEKQFPTPGVFVTEKPRLFGIVELCLNRLPKKKFEIKFEGKLAFWNYFVISRKNSSPKLVYKVPANQKIHLVYGSSVLKFQQLNPNMLDESYQNFLEKLRRTISDPGTEFSVFRSERPLPVSEVLNTGIILKKKNFRGRNSEEGAIANPRPSDVLRVESDPLNHHIFSLIDISN